MLQKAELLVREANELKDLCMAQMDEMVLDYMDEETKNTTVELYTKMYNLMDVSLELVVEQAKLFEELDTKIDKLLAMMEAR